MTYYIQWTGKQLWLMNTKASAASRSIAKRRGAAFLW